jgi:hypothetical protein
MKPSAALSWPIRTGCRSRDEGVPISRREHNFEGGNGHFEVRAGNFEGASRYFEGTSCTKLRARILLWWQRVSRFARDFVGSSGEK